MVNNKQVNIWRGDKFPPTIYHIWIKDNQKLLLYNGFEWVVFVDNKDILDTLQEIIDRVTVLENCTVNGKPIVENPVLTGTDITTESNGTYINSKDNLSTSILNIDSLLTTQIIE